MQFNFNVNDILKNELTIVDNKIKLGYIPSGTDINTIKLLDNGQKLSYIIDQMGRASALAQELSGPITTGSKLRHSDHRLYLLKVDDGINGEVVGLLKVGYKTLFIYDIQSHQNELRPLCILDFYVHESKQRKGYGRILFDWMLQSENVLPHHIAVDRPSSKFLFFLAKHYQLTEKIPQLNNFVVFVNFFNGRIDMNSNHQRRQRSLPAPSPMQTPLTLSHAQLSPPQVTEQVHRVISPANISNQNIKRRPQSSSGKDRAAININDLSLTQSYTDPVSGDGEPPLLTRDGVPRNYRSLLTPGQRMASANDKVSRNSHLPRIGPRSPDKCCPGTSTGTGQMVSVPSNKGQYCARSRRDYDYSVGLARNYSHTRLW